MTGIDEGQSLLLSPKEYNRLLTKGEDEQD